MIFNSGPFTLKVPWFGHLFLGSSNQHIISDSDIRPDDTKKWSLIYFGYVTVVD